LARLKLTAREIEGLRGRYLDSDNAVITEDPPDDAAFPICAGPWPNPHVGARQARCVICNGFVGISPRGWALHRVWPAGRPVLCAECCVPLVALLDEETSAHG
jgi:hypothetical protein